MKCERVAFVSDLPSGVVEELIFTNIIFRLVVYLCLEEIVLIFSVRVRATKIVGRINSVLPLRMFLGEITKNVFLHQKGSGADVPNTGQLIDIKWTISIHIRSRSEFRQVIRMDSLSHGALNLLPINILGCVNQTR